MAEQEGCRSGPEAILGGSGRDNNRRRTVAPWKQNNRTTSTTARNPEKTAYRTSGNRSLSPESFIIGMVAWTHKTTSRICIKMPNMCYNTHSQQRTSHLFFSTRIPMAKSRNRSLPPEWFHLNGSNYLIIVDYFSRYPEVTKQQSTTSQTIINSLKSTFARHGIPEILRSDNGPQFTSTEFKDFVKEYQFTHTTSSPYYPASNGQVERMVKTVKSLLKDADDPYLALLSYRATPLP